MTKQSKIIRVFVLCLVLVHLFAMTCFADSSFDGIQVWTEGSLTPATQEVTAEGLKVVSTNAAGDWWKVKLELPRTVEQGKTYEATFVFTSDATGTIKYVVDGANFLGSNEYTVQNGANTFKVRFTAGADTYNCLELGGLGAFTLTFSQISVVEEKAEEEPGEHTHNYANGKCSCGEENGFAGVQVWTEGSLTPATREDTADTMTVSSANAAGDWWKVKVELPRSVEQGKTYEATFVFTSNTSGPIKYNVDGATYLNSNEYNVQIGENTFTVQFTAGADTYNCLELGGLDNFRLTFSKIQVAEVVEGDNPPATGDTLGSVLCAAAVAAAGIAFCVITRKRAF